MSKKNKDSKCGGGPHSHGMPGSESGFPLHIQIGDPCDCFGPGDTWMDVMDPERMAKRAAEKGSYIVTSFGSSVGDSYVENEGPSFGTPPDWWPEFQRQTAADKAAMAKASADREAADWARRNPKAPAAARAPAPKSSEPIVSDMLPELFEATLNALEKGHRNAFLKIVGPGNVKAARASDGFTSLHLAVARQDRELVAHAVEQGANKEARDHRKRTPLLLALAEGRDGAEGPNRPHEVVDALVELEADVNAVDEEGNSCLHHAVTNPAFGFETAQLLVRKGARPLERNHKGLTPCKIAVEQRGAGYAERLIKLMKNKCNLVDPQALVAAAETGQHYLVKMVLDLAKIPNTKSGGGKSVLYCVICNRKNYKTNADWLNTLRMLLSSGADPIEQDSEFSPVFGITRYGNKDAFKLLMGYCAEQKQNLPSKELIILAAKENDDPKMLKFLENYYLNA